MKKIRANATSGTQRGPRGGIFHFSENGVRVSGPAPANKNRKPASEDKTLTTRQPSGTPLSQHVVTKVYRPKDTGAAEANVKMASHVTSALKLIDSVHGDGGVHDSSGKMLIWVDKAKDEHGFFEPERGPRKPNGGVQEIALNNDLFNRDSRAIMATVIHELGHSIDYNKIGLSEKSWDARENGEKQFNEWGKEKLRDAHNSRLRDALINSESVKNLKKLHAEVDEAIKPHIAYLLDPKEIFARAYTQYIATRASERGSTDAKGIENDVSGHAYNLHGGHEAFSHWDPNEFKHIADAMDGVMQNIGWQK